MNDIDISGIQPVERLFHNEKIKTYEKNLSFTDIRHWSKNLRTVLAFDVLEDRLKKSLKKISPEEITTFLAGRPELKLNKLAKSIAANGVRVPLIVLTDRTLLDGNRRYFACSYIYHHLSDKTKLPDSINNIPVWVIKKEDISPPQQNKILAEANFVEDLKVPWSTDVKAKVIDDYFKQCLNDGKTEEDIYSEIKDVYSLKKAQVIEFVDTIKLTHEFIETAKGDNVKEFKLREILLKKFVYFWEFRNKAYKGGGRLEKEELNEVKPLFFKMVENACFKNIKQVEPMIRAYRDKNWWTLLRDSNGTKIAQVEVLSLEKKAIKSTEDKVRNFSRWLDKLETDNFTGATVKLLNQLAKKINALEDKR